MATISSCTSSSLSSRSLLTSSTEDNIVIPAPEGFGDDDLVRTHDIIRSPSYRASHSTRSSRGSEETSPRQGHRRLSLPQQQQRQQRQRHDRRNSVPLSLTSSSTSPQGIKPKQKKTNVMIRTLRKLVYSKQHQYDLAWQEGDYDRIKALLSSSSSSSVTATDMMTTTTTTVGNTSISSSLLSSSSSSILLQPNEGTTSGVVCRDPIDHHDTTINVTATTNSDGDTPLHVACCRNDYDMIKFLLDKKGIHVDGKNRINGNTPLHYACYYNHEHVVKLLVEQYHADVDRKNRHGETPLHYATRNGNIDIVKYLLHTKLRLRRSHIEQLRHVNEMIYNDDMNQRIFQHNSSRHDTAAMTTTGDNDNSHDDDPKYNNNNSDTATTTSPHHHERDIQFCLVSNDNHNGSRNDHPHNHRPDLNHGKVVPKQYGHDDITVENHTSKRLLRYHHPHHDCDAAYHVVTPPRWQSERQLPIQRSSMASSSSSSSSSTTTSSSKSLSARNVLLLSSPSKSSSSLLPPNRGRRWREH